MKCYIPEAPHNIGVHFKDDPCAVEKLGSKADFDRLVVKRKRVKVVKIGDEPTVSLTGGMG